MIFIVRKMGRLARRLLVTPHTCVIPAEAGIQVFFTNKGEGLDSRVEFTLMKMGAGMTNGRM